MPVIVSKIAQYPHRILAFTGLFALFLTIPLSAIIVFSTVQKSGTKAKAAFSIPSVPLIDRQDAVVIGEKKLCSFVGANQNSVGIVGEDGGESVRVGNTTYFAFGDTTTNSAMLPNSVATTSDIDASDCFTMTSKSSKGAAVPMLPKLNTECTVWPLDMVNTTGADIYFFYYSFSVNNCNQRLGMGLGKMDANTLNTTRINNFFWQPGDAVTPNFDINGAAFTKVGTDVYIMWNGQDTGGRDLTMLSKVAVANIGNKAAYTYWDGTSFQSNPALLKPLWDQGGVPTHGMTIRFNSFLGKWTAIYNTGYSSIMAARTADNITGPWSGETTIVNCLQHYELGTSSGTAFPCYGAKEHPWYERNNGQIIYASHSNSVLYQPFLHEITFGRAVNQWVDLAGNSIYKQDGQQVSNFVQEGTAFYASPNQLPNFQAIHDWAHGSEHVYAVSSPGGSFADLGIAFYAPTTPQFSLAAINQWNKGTLHRYSALDLSSYGYTKGSVAFYAKITNYRIMDTKVFPQNGSFFQIGVKANNSWVSGGHLKDAVFSGLNSGTNYSIATNTPFSGNKFFGQNITADSGGNITSSGDLPYVNILNLGVFSQNQTLDTTSDLFAYWVHHTNVFDNPPEIGHQLNPYSRASNFKSFFLTGNVNGTYQGNVCKPDCSGAGVWSGAVNFCGNDLTLSPTGPTICSSLSNFTLSGLTANTQYDLYYCSPNCDDALVRIVYPRTSDVTGIVKYQVLPVPASSSPTPTPQGSPQPILTDSDGDGCIDSKELGGDWKLGGQRDPNNRWDFFDVPVPAITAASAALPVGDPGRPKFNKAISSSDTLAIVYYIGTKKGGVANANGVSYDTHYGYQLGLTTDPNFTDGMFYDRTPTTDFTQPWRSGAPSGAVSVQDALVANVQVGTNCN